MRSFQSILYLDDMRIPSILGIEVVTNYDEFVWHLEHKGVPELISFDHDLALEHYPLFEEDAPGRTIPYDRYKEKTGWHCARYIVENQLPLQYWAVHSFNPSGGANIARELRAYRPQGEVRGLVIPYRLRERERYEGLVVKGYRQN